MASKKHCHHSSGLSPWWCWNTHSLPTTVHPLHCLFFPTHKIFLVSLTQFFLYRFCGWSGCLLSSQTNLWVVVVSLTLQCVLLGSSYILGTGVCSFYHIGISSVDPAQPEGEPLISCHSCFIFQRVESGVFSLCILGSGASFPHAQVGRLYFLPQCGLCKFSRWLRCPGWTVVFPMLWVVFTVTFWDCCNSLGSCFGHDRAKNDSRVVFP